MWGSLPMKPLRQGELGSPSLRVRDSFPQVACPLHINLGQLRT